MTLEPPIYPRCTNARGGGCWNPLLRQRLAGGVQGLATWPRFSYFHWLGGSLLSTKASRLWTQFFGWTYTSFMVTSKYWLRLPQPARVELVGPQGAVFCLPILEIRTHSSLWNSNGKSVPHGSQVQKEPPWDNLLLCFCFQRSASSKSSPANFSLDAPGWGKPLVTPCLLCTNAKMPYLGSWELTRERSVDKEEVLRVSLTIPRDSMPCPSPGGALSQGRTWRRQLDGNIC